MNKRCLLRRLAGVGTLGVLAACGGGAAPPSEGPMPTPESITQRQGTTAPHATRAARVPALTGKPRSRTGSG